ncbi:MAG: DNA-binding GntR family transcriptional regulator [Planctomycetota bacterium]|jgi:DNA-binding GntR family transcriptional regulator
MDSSANKLETAKTSVQTIQTAIIRRICFLDTPPGTQLKEAELAQEFGVSRTPVRDAISRIKHLGLVETRNGVGTVVVSLTPDQIKHVYEMRLELAALIGAMSPKAVSDQAKVQIGELLMAAITLEQSFDARSYVELNDQLQNLITDLIGNALLQSFWQQAYLQAASTWYHVAILASDEAAAALVQELTQLNEALMRDDIAAVGHIQRVQIGYGYQRIKRHLLPEQS